MESSPSGALPQRQPGNIFTSNTLATIHEDPPISPPRGSSEAPLDNQFNVNLIEKDEEHERSSGEISRIPVMSIRILILMHVD
jgi:hypothetical protein